MNAPLTYGLTPQEIRTLRHEIVAEMHDLAAVGDAEEFDRLDLVQTGLLEAERAAVLWRARN